jgi:hypothetical protein
MHGESLAENGICEADKACCAQRIDAPLGEGKIDRLCKVEWGCIGISEVFEKLLVDRNSVKEAVYQVSVRRSRHRNLVQQRTKRRESLQGPRRQRLLSVALLDSRRKKK